jgi:hypothetical protein
MNQDEPCVIFDLHEIFALESYLIDVSDYILYRDKYDKFLPVSLKFPEGKPLQLIFGKDSFEVKGGMGVRSGDLIFKHSQLYSIE